MKQVAWTAFALAITMMVSGCQPPGGQAGGFSGSSDVGPSVVIEPSLASNMAGFSLKGISCDGVPLHVFPGSDRCSAGQGTYTSGQKQEVLQTSMVLGSHDALRYQVVLFQSPELATAGVAGASLLITQLHDSWASNDSPYKIYMSDLGKPSQAGDIAYVTATFKPAQCAVFSRLGTLPIKGDPVLLFGLVCQGGVDHVLTQDDVKAFAGLIKIDG